jgi:putative transposase
MTMKILQYTTTKLQVYQLNYHFVFCTRYRRKILIDSVKNRCKELIAELAIKQEWEIITTKVGPDFCHLHISVTPQLAPSDIVAKIKRFTSQLLRQEFEHLHHLPSIWTRAFLTSTEPQLASEIITQFIQSQKTRG